MKYETPELTVLTPAINAIQSESTSSKMLGPGPDGVQSTHNEGSGAYADWE